MSRLSAVMTPAGLVPPRLRDFKASAVAAWDRWFFSDADPLAPAVFRIFLGLLMTAVFILLYPNWETYYAADGMASVDVSSAARASQDAWCLFYWTDPWIPVRFWWWAALVAAAGLTLGWRTRLSIVALFILQTSMIHRNRMAVNGEDLMFRMLLFYGCFAPLGHALSADRLRWGKPPPAAVWPIRLMQINVALIYLINVPYKLAEDAVWRNGDALYWALINGTWSRWPWKGAIFGSLAMAAIKASTFGSLLLEFSFPLIVLFRRVRIYVLAAMMLFHISIAVLLQNVTFFTLAMVCSFWLYMPGDRLRQWVSRLGLSAYE